MDQSYEAWLRRQGYDENTINAQLYRAGRVEDYYGDFDKHYEEDRLLSIIEAFVYTTEDARKNRPNPTLIPFKGAVAGNMNGYKFAVRLYRRFREETDDDSVGPGESAPSTIQKPREISRKIRPRPAFEHAENPATLAHFGLDGFAALQALIAGSTYMSLAQAIASLTLFSHPDTVRQTGGSLSLGQSADRAHPAFMPKRTEFG